MTTQFNGYSAPVTSGPADDFDARTRHLVKPAPPVQVPEAKTKEAVAAPAKPKLTPEEAKQRRIEALKRANEARRAKKDAAAASTAPQSAPAAPSTPPVTPKLSDN